jgi:hypothetical protein
MIERAYLSDAVVAAAGRCKASRGNDLAALLWWMD